MIYFLLSVGLQSIIRDSNKTIPKITIKVCKLRNDIGLQTGSFECLKCIMPIFICFIEFT